ncbi:MAG: D-glycero-beta-D-manno-heptose 1,7-bisphosphate 7-phosphatase [Gammaproteobacteria bacterium]
MKLIILDRDGVINYDSDDCIKSEEEWQPIPGSLEAIGRLCNHGYHIVVVTNQAGLAHNKLSIEDLMCIHRRMHTQVARFRGSIEAVFFCPHAEDEDCRCRKPKPGMLNDVSRRLRVPLDNVTFIGDKHSDVEAGQAAGCSPVLVKTGYGRSHIEAGRIPDTVPVYNNLSEYVEELLA